jgi:hypothetical protein
MKKGSSKCISMAKQVVLQSWGASNGTFVTDTVGDIEISLLILQELEGFTYATAFGLNIGYYIIRLDPMASKMCTIIFPPLGKVFLKETAHGL